MVGAALHRAEDALLARVANRLPGDVVTGYGHSSPAMTATVIRAVATGRCWC